MGIKKYASQTAWDRGNMEPIKLMGLVQSGAICYDSSPLRLNNGEQQDHKKYGRVVGAVGMWKNIFPHVTPSVNTQTSFEFTFCQCAGHRNKTTDFMNALHT